MSRKARAIRTHRIELKKGTKAAKAVTPSLTSPVTEIKVPVAKTKSTMSITPEPAAEPAAAEATTEIVANSEMSDGEIEQLREAARDKGIGHWWSKSPDRLLIELGKD